MTELISQLQNPQVWLGLALSLVIAYALYRFGRMVLRALERHLNHRFLTGLKWLWLLTVGVGWLAVATNIANLKNVPLLSALGEDILLGSKHSLGQLLVVLAMALIAWNLIGAATARIVADEEFNRRSVRVQTLKGVIESTLKVAIVVISLIAALQTVGVNAAGLLAGVSVLGLAVGFGAQSLIKDVFNGFFILLEDQYGVGDVISVNGGQLSGGVEHLNLRVTNLRALDGTVHIIPNGQINTVSVSSKDWSRVVAEVDVTYNANINHALKVLEAVSNEIYESDEWKHFFLDKPEVQGVTQLAPDGVTIRALFKVQPKSQYAIGREFNRRIKIAMDQAGIDIPTQQRNLNFSGTPIEIKLTRDDLREGAALKSQDRQHAPVQPVLTRNDEEGELS